MHLIVKDGDDTEDLFLGVRNNAIIGRLIFAQPTGKVTYNATILLDAFIGKVAPEYRLDKRPPTRFRITHLSREVATITVESTHQFGLILIGDDRISKAFDVVLNKDAQFAFSVLSRETQEMFLGLYETLDSDGLVLKVERRDSSLSLQEADRLSFYACYIALIYNDVLAGLRNRN